MRNDRGHALPSAGILVARAPVRSLGSVIRALQLLTEGGFLWNRGLPLVLWLWHWNTVVCRRQYIIAPGCPLCSVSSFLEGFCVSWEMKHVQHLPQPGWFQKALGPVLLFRFWRVGEGHENSQQGRLPLNVKTGAMWLSSVTFFFFWSLVFVALLKSGHASYTKLKLWRTWTVCHPRNVCRSSTSVYVTHF